MLALLVIAQLAGLLPPESSELPWFYEDFRYVGPFVVLLLCGVGLPLPEEVTLIGSGILVYREEVEFVPIVLVCSAAILIGDSIPFLLGRRYGLSALKIRWVARIVHPERFARIERKFEEHGNWAVFLCRFFAGVRIPGYFVGGTMGMPYARFLLLDTLGVVISVPLSIYLGMLFGGQIEKLQRSIADFHLILGFLVAALVLILVVRARRKPRSNPPPALFSDETGEVPPEVAPELAPDAEQTAEQGAEQAAEPEEGRSPRG